MESIEQSRHTYASGQLQIIPHTTYHKWRTQRALYPYCEANTCNHHTRLLTQYYMIRQYKHCSHIVNAHFSTSQQKDTRYVTPPTNIPHALISINECNPDNDIETTSATIQIQFDVAHIYEDTGRHLITIPKTRLQWLWKQYHMSHNTTHGLQPPTQSFETEIVWLYQRYKYRIPKNDPLKRAQYTLSSPILDLLITTFNINHTYFSSPVTCPTHFSQFYSPFSRDIIFGSLGKAFAHKWQGIGYAHPHNATDLQQAIHWVRLAAQTDPHTITILVSPDTDWYQNSTPHQGPFQDTHVIAHFAADTIIYEEPTIPSELNLTRREPSTIQIFCIHHQDNNIATSEQMKLIHDMANSLRILHSHTQIAPLTPSNVTVNVSKTGLN